MNSVLGVKAQRTQPTPIKTPPMKIMGLVPNRLLRLVESGPVKKRMLNHMPQVLTFLNCQLISFYATTSDDDDDDDDDDDCWNVTSFQQSFSYSGQTPRLLCFVLSMTRSMGVRTTQPAQLLQ